jgi:predicted transcriptional regulator
MKTAIISVKPEYVEKIFSGEKQFEYRKNYINASLFIIYATAPTSAVVGMINASVTKATPDYIWRYTNHVAGISKEAFFEYFNGKEKAFAYHICGIVKFPKPIPLEYFGLKRPPQSFCYLKGENNEK